MVKAVPSANMIGTKVFLHCGQQAGLIEELIIDPCSGIVRFSTIRTDENMSVLMPWAAMIFAKSKGAFVLTDKGECILRGRNVSSVATFGRTP